MASHSSPGTRRSLGPLAALVAAMLVVAACSPAPSSAPTTSPPPPTATPSTTAAPTPTASPAITQPTARPLPTGPAASDALLGDVYAALRPMNLRTASGPRTFDRGGEVRLYYEMVNTGSTSVQIPRTIFANRAAGWIGIQQTWIERLGSNPDLKACLPNAARDGRRYAFGGLPAQLGVADIAVQPGQGRTLQSSIPAASTACFPVGSYRVTIEYRRLEAQGVAARIASVAIDIALRTPTAWSARPSLAGTGQATLALTRDGSHLTSTFELSQLGPSVKYTYEVRIGCDRDGAVLVAPVTFRSAANGSYRDSRVVAVSASARRALAAGGMPSLWLFRGAYGACTSYTGASAASPQGRAPTTWGGALLRENLGSGFAVTAYAMAIRPGDGRPSQAFDDDVNLTWNSGFGAPGWIEIDLGRDRTVSGLRLLPSQLPSPAPTVHRIYGRENGSVTETLLATLDGVTRDNVWLDVTFAAARAVRYVRIETVTSPSTIAWREIKLAGVTIPRQSRMPVGTHDGTKLSVAAGASCEAVGWTSDPDATTDLTVRVLVDGKAVGTTVAGLPRDDVAVAGAGDRTSGFQVFIRPWLTLGVQHEIRVQAQDLETGRWVDLAATPRLLTCT